MRPTGSCSRRLARPPSQGCWTVLLPPFDRSLQAFFEGCLRCETERVKRARGVEHAPRLAVRLSRVPAHRASEADQPPDCLRQVTDSYLPPGAQVDRLRAVVALRGECYALGRVVDVEKL